MQICAPWNNAILLGIEGVLKILLRVVLLGCAQASLVLTVQRFLSLVFSAAVLNSPPPPPNSLWVGSGTLPCLLLRTDIKLLR